MKNLFISTKVHLWKHSLMRACMCILFLFVCVCVHSCVKRKIDILIDTDRQLQVDRYTDKEEKDCYRQTERKWQTSQHAQRKKRTKQRDVIRKCLFESQWTQADTQPNKGWRPTRYTHTNDYDTGTLPKLTKRLVFLENRSVSRVSSSVSGPKTGGPDRTRFWANTPEHGSVFTKREIYIVIVHYSTAT